MPIVAIMPSTTNPTTTTSAGNDTDWPSLEGRDKQQKMDPSGSSEDHNDDWEMLSPPDHGDEYHGEESKHATTTVVVGVPDNFHPDAELPPIAEKGMIPKSNPKILRHSASSPDLRHLSLVLEEEGEGNDDDEGKYDDHNPATSRKQSHDDSSYSIVSRPGSVMSSWSNTKISFRDAILSNNNTQNNKSGGKTVAWGTLPSTTTTRSRQHQIRVQPRFIVVAPPKSLKRCAKSTGDLQSLSVVPEQQEVLGDSDAPEFYDRKAMGQKGRENGLKLRPDELKRKEMVIYKKDLQRAGRL